MRAPTSSLFLALALSTSGLAATPYRVQNGDTLIGIAERAGVSVAQIRAVNPALKKSSVVKVGLTINIPNRQLDARKYHVQEGENLTTIARKFGMSAQQLIRSNPAYRNGKNVWAGAVITIPGRNVVARLGRRSGAAVVRTTAIRVTETRQASQEAPRQMANGWMWPIPGHHYISSGFGERELEGNEAMHYGLDIVAPVGTPVLAARSGRVIESRPDFKRGWGWTVVLEHPDGWITRYAHLSQNLVKTGERVVQGQRVGRVGNTGRSTGPHLHYGTYLRWNPRDPLGLYD